MKVEVEGTWNVTGVIASGTTQVYKIDVEDLDVDEKASEKEIKEAAKEMAIEYLWEEATQNIQTMIESAEVVE